MHPRNNDNIATGPATTWPEVPRESANKSALGKDQKLVEHQLIRHTLMIELLKKWYAGIRDSLMTAPAPLFNNACNWKNVTHSFYFLIIPDIYI